MSSEREQAAHWHIVHALEYVGNSCDETTRKRRTAECIELLAKEIAATAHP